MDAPLVYWKSPPSCSTGVLPTTPGPITCRRRKQRGPPREFKRTQTPEKWLQKSVAIEEQAQSATLHCACLLCSR